MGIDHILAGVNNKERAAWEKLYADYYAALCTYANGIIKDDDTAQDVVQETLIKIWKSDKKFGDIKELTYYLYKAVYNNSLFYLRGKNNRGNTLQPEEVDIPDEQLADTVQEELLRQLYLGIEDLPEERKKIMLLSVKGLSGNEIADKLGITLNTVKTQKNRSFKYLREKLKNSLY